MNYKLIAFNCFAIVVLLFLAVSCKSDDEASNPQIPSRLVLLKMQGDEQVAQPYQNLPLPLRVRVLDELTRPKSGLEVSFTIVEGGGALSHSSGLTNDLGIAQVNWRIGGLGLQRMAVSVLDSEGSHVENSPMEFTATFPLSECETISDVDGNEYPIALIGNKCWMVENLRTTRFRNGEAIPQVTDNAGWEANDEPAYCTYNNENQPEIYGNLYNWYAVDDPRQLCPAGWRLPTNQDFDALVAQLGGALEAGGSMKFVGLDYWNNPNTAATNASGFSAVGGSSRHLDGNFFDFGNRAAIWTSEEATQFTAWMRYLYNNQGNIVTMGNDKRSGLSVRCIAE